MLLSFWNLDVMNSMVSKYLSFKIHLKIKKIALNTFGLLHVKKLNQINKNNVLDFWFINYSNLNENRKKTRKIST